MTYADNLTRVRHWRDGAITGMQMVLLELTGVLSEERIAEIRETTTAHIFDHAKDMTESVPDPYAYLDTLPKTLMLGGDDDDDEESR